MRLTGTYADEYQLTTGQAYFLNGAEHQTAFKNSNTMKNSLFILKIIALAVIFTACSITKYTIPKTEDKERNHSVIVINNPISLADFLVRVPGVFVDEKGSRTIVTIRGGKPLFIVDGVRLGNSYASAASVLSIHDIDSVEVLKSSSETIIYGREAAFGVIIIKTKR